MNLEDYFITKFHNRFIGDDGVVVENGWVYSKDAFFEGVHFHKKWLSYYEIAKKAMLVNISDAIAMNALPKYALLSVAMPKTMKRKDMDALALGFLDAAKSFGIEIVGGDTISNTKLDITVTIISKTKRPLYRTGVKRGDVLAYTGVLGNAAKELKKLLRNGRVHTHSKFTHLQLRQRFVQKSRRKLQAGMDISDGLMSDLSKMMRLNKSTVQFTRNIPKSIGCSGEEYEMLVAFDRRHKKAVIRLAQHTQTPLTIIGKAVRGKFYNRCKAHHF